jgi:hypothetical protein
MTFKRLLLNDGQSISCLIFITVICGLIVIGSAPLRFSGHLIASDGMQYYAITRSVILDGDFNFTNDYALLGVRYNARPTPLGLPGNPFAIGTAILWMPFFIVAHILSLTLNFLGLHVPINGIGMIYEAVVCLATIFYIGLGMVLTYLTIQKTRMHSPSLTLSGILGMWLATPAIFYTIIEPSMSHGMTIFSNALFLFVWYPPSSNRSVFKWVVIGCVTGLVSLVRWQDGIIATLPVVELLWWVITKKIKPVQAAYRLLIFGGTVILLFFPQMMMWKALYGTFVTIPQGSDFVVWSQPKIIPILISTRHGLLSWHPIFILALLGIIPLWKRDKVLAMVVTFVFIAELYVNSSVSDWWASSSFGGRRFTSMIPFFSISLTAVLVAFRDKLKWFLALIVLLTIWNGLSLIQFYLGFVSTEQALTLREMTVDRLLIPIRLVQRFLH